MTRTIIISMLLLLGGALTAQADTSIYRNISKQPRGDQELQVATQYCTARIGPDRNGVRTSPQFKRCMLGQGWRWRRTQVVKKDPSHYIDPDTGMDCQSTGWGAAVCSPPSGTVRYINRHGLNCERTGIVSVCTNF